MLSGAVRRSRNISITIVCVIEIPRQARDDIGVFELLTALVSFRTDVRNLPCSESLNCYEDSSASPQNDNQSVMLSGAVRRSRNISVTTICVIEIPRQARDDKICHIIRIDISKSLRSFAMGVIHLGAVSLHNKSVYQSIFL